MHPAAGDESQLVRAMGRWTLVALVINSIIGSGIFGLPSLIAEYLGRLAPLGYLMAAAGMGVIMACFAEVASRFTEAGGAYLYARVAFGSFVGIQTGWLSWLVRLTAMAANANIFVIYLGEFWPQATAGGWRVAVLTLLLGVLLAINVRGVRGGAQLSNLFTVAKLVPLIALILAGGFFILSRPAAGAAGPPTSLRPRDAMEAMLLLVFAYGGFESAMMPLGEARDPRRDAPFALLMALATCAVVYTLIQIVVMRALPDPAHGSRPLAEAARITMGSAGAVLITAGALFSTYGFLSANMLNTPRLTFALAEQRDFPAFFGAVHRRFRTPYISLAISAGLCWMLAMAGSFRWNAVLSAVARLFTYGAVCAAVPVLRRKQPGQARFTLPCGSAFATMGVVLCALMASRMGKAELAIVLVTAGIAALNWWWARGDREQVTRDRL